jgi:acyl carrier protein
MATTRDEMFEVIKSNLHKIVEGSRDQEILPDRSMKDYGADSLEMIEVVSRSMKELRIRVPRTELSGATNLGELLDLFERAAQASTAA